VTIDVDRRRLSLLISSFLTHGCFSGAKLPLNAELGLSFEPDEGVGWITAESIIFSTFADPNRTRRTKVNCLESESSASGLFPVIIDGGRYIASNVPGGFNLCSPLGKTLFIKVPDSPDSLCIDEGAAEIACLFGSTEHKRVSFFDLGTGMKIRTVDLVAPACWHRISLAAGMICLSSHQGTILYSNSDGKELDRLPLRNSEINSKGTFLAGETEARDVSVIEVKSRVETARSKGSAAWACWHPRLPVCRYSMLDMMGYTKAICLQRIPNGKVWTMKPVVPYKPVVGAWLRASNFPKMDFEK
jgi:hypothetical protein